MSGLYLHIPFCKQACSYCDFYFVTRHHQKQDFVDALIKEIESYRNSRITKEPIKSVYFGGGTPSLLNANQFEQILEAIAKTFKLAVEELTVEMNPDDVKPGYLGDLKSLGINRASMGVQSFDESLLAFMHRAHNRAEALKSLEYLSTAGFDNFTVDLIYGNPGQSLEVLESDIETLLSFNPPHISAYSLTVEPHTRLGKQVELGRIIAPEDDQVATHFDTIVSRLADAGIHQYEVSNYAKPGHEAVHNSAYWSHQNYLGLGPAAHSLWWEADRAQAQRWRNESDLKSYINDPINQKVEIETLNLTSLAEERLMLGLRTKQGVSFSELQSRYQYLLSEKQRDYLNKRQVDGFVMHNEDSIALTPDGLKIADSIILDLITSA
ncbi:MAG: radical SAM family heme chaperone HemW [Balneolaceae bacterium]|nr:radical SAM family heme chaperone HemW [Balneolaceae bacterium]